MYLIFAFFYFLNEAKMRLTKENVIDIPYSIRKFDVSKLWFRNVFS